MKQLTFIGLIFLICLNGNAQETMHNGVPVKAEEKARELFPDIRRFEWTISDDYYMAESNCLRLVPDSLPHQNGYLMIKFSKGANDGKWHSTYRHYISRSDIEKNVPEQVLIKIKLKFRDLGDKAIGNVGITDCSEDCRTPPIGQKYAVFGFNKQTSDMGRYYFNAAGDFIEWPKHK